MKSVYNFVVEPIGERYNNVKKIGDSELITNTEVFNHQHVNRLAKVISTPAPNWPTEVHEVKIKIIRIDNIKKRKYRN